MRHRKSGIKLNRTGSHRKAMFRNMVTSLFKHDRIQTTDAKAKELRGWADHLITLAKRGDLHARRQALAIVREKAVVHKLFEEVENRFGARQGGYTRVIKLGQRKGDAAPISLIELVTEEKAPKPKKKKKTKPAPAVKTETAKQAAEAADAAQEPVDAEAPEKAEKKASPKKKTAKAEKDAEAPEAPEKAKKKASPKKKTAKAEKDAEAPEAPEKAEKKKTPKKKTEQD